MSGIKPTTETSYDPIDYPSHYTQGKIEFMDAVDGLDLGFHEGTILKYLVRWKHKRSPVEDLKKARWYLNRLIQIAEKGQSEGQREGRCVICGGLTLVWSDGFGGWKTCPNCKDE